MLNKVLQKSIERKSLTKYQLNIFCSPQVVTNNLNIKLKDITLDILQKKLQKDRLIIFNIKKLSTKYLNILLGLQIDYLNKCNL